MKEDVGRCYAVVNPETKLYMGFRVDEFNGMGYKVSSYGTDEKGAIVPFNVFPNVKSPREELAALGGENGAQDMGVMEAELFIKCLALMNYAITPAKK